jgi:hypothetical protein
LENAATLTLAATLPSGKPDPALGTAGRSLGVGLTRQRAGEEQQLVEMLAADDSLDVLVGETVIRVSR